LGEKLLEDREMRNLISAKQTKEVMERRREVEARGGGRGGAIASA